jgi:hypothetical protein
MAVTGYDVIFWLGCGLMYKYYYVFVFFVGIIAVM